MNTPFYEAVLPPTGPYCAVGIRDSRVIVTFHDSLVDLEQKTQEHAKNGLHSYFALATFVDRKLGRKGYNAKELKSFFLDLDIGEDKGLKGYPDRTSALVSLREFLKATKLPDPSLTDSGRGFHVYWPLTQALSLEEWRPFARRFKKLCLDNGLRIDPVVPADSARVLRSIGTLNFKVNPPAPIQIISTVDPIPLESFVAVLPELVDLSAAKAYGVDDFTRALAQGDYPPTEFSRIVRKSLKDDGCAQIKRAVVEAKTLEEPLWRAALSIAWRCTDAETAIHRVSEAHPGYNPDDTLAKAQATVGPMTCKWYRDNYPKDCEKCPQKITSPIQLGRKIEATAAVDGAYLVTHPVEPDNTSEAPNVVQVQIPEYPFPYFRGAHGGVFIRRRNAKTDEMEEHEIYKYDLYVTNRHYDYHGEGEGEGERVTVSLHTPHDGIRSFIAPVTSLLVKEKAQVLLSKHGVIAYGKEFEGIMAYIASSIKNLQRLAAADRTRNQMGWTSDLRGFVIGELEYTPTGVRLAPASSATRQIVPALMTKGKLEEWSKIANFYSRPGMETHALALFFGMGAPLLRLFGGIEVRGALINLMSNKSGTGKTTLQTVINSLFGHPVELLLKHGDTMHSRVQILGLLNNIAATIDEMTNVKDEVLSEFVYEIPQGRGRHRLESQSNKLRANTTSWMTFVISSTNSSLYDKLGRLKATADGEIRRMIELRITRPVAINKAESDQIFAPLSMNYGLAGPKFVQYVMNNMEETTKIFNQFKTRIDTDMKLDQSDRYYSISFAVAMTAGYIYAKLGLITIDVAQVYRCALEHLSRIKREVVQPVINPSDVASEVLSTFLNENIPNTLVINGEKGELPQPALHTPRGPVRVRFEPDTKEVWIPATVLRDYFVERQVDVKSAIREFRERNLMKLDGQAHPKRISAGALDGFSASSIRSYCFNAEALGLDTDDILNKDSAKPTTLDDL